MIIFPYFWDQETTNCLVDLKMFWFIISLSLERQLKIYIKDLQGYGVFLFIILILFFSFEVSAVTSAVSSL